MMNTENIVLQMAPFQGITTSVFRNIYTQYFSGIDKLFTPFFTGIQKKELNRARAAELAEPLVNNIPLVPQILSKDADEILRFANYVHALGFDEINWNLGCPFPRVTAKKRGSGLLPYPNEVRAILEKVMAEIPVRFSVKARLGLNNQQEILNLLPVINDFDMAELTIHARIGKQLYKGEVDIKTFKKVVTRSNVNTGYNGDIFTLDDFDRFSSQFPTIKIIMLGRGLLADPFLPAIIKGIHSPSPEDAVWVEKFITELYLQYRKKFNDHLTSLNVMKEYWWYLAHSFHDPHKVFKRIKKTKRFEDFENAVKHVFETYQWTGQRADLFRKSRISK